MTGAELLPLLAAGAGTGLSMLGQRKAADERRDILNRQLQRTQDTQDRSAQLVQDEGQHYQADERTKAIQDQQEATYQQSRQDLGDAPTIIDGAGDAGAVSGDYLNAKVERALTEGNRLTAIARELAKTRAPHQLQTTEAMRRANLGGELESMWGADKASANASQLDADSVQEPWWGALGKVAAAAGTAAGLNAPLASGVDYGLSGARFGEAAQPSFWSTAGKGGIRFGG